MRNSCLHISNSSLCNFNAQNLIHEHSNVPAITTPKRYSAHAQNFSQCVNTMVKTRKSSAENLCTQSDDEGAYSSAIRRRSQRLSASMNVSTPLRSSSHFRHVLRVILIVRVAKDIRSSQRERRTKPRMMTQRVARMRVGKKLLDVLRGRPSAVTRLLNVERKLMS